MVALHDFTVDCNRPLLTDWLLAQTAASGASCLHNITHQEGRRKTTSYMKCWKSYNRTFSHQDVHRKVGLSDLAMGQQTYFPLNDK